MNKNTSLANFTNQYQLSKTLRFELKPVGRTAEWIEKHNIIGVDSDNNLTGTDAERAKHYKYAKRILDAMHRIFIEDALGLIADEKLLNQLKTKFAELQTQNEIAIDQDLQNIFKNILDITANRWIAINRKCRNSGVKTSRSWRKNLRLKKTISAKKAFRAPSRRFRKSLTLPTR